MKKIRVRIEGVSQPVDVSEIQHAYIMDMIKNRRSNHWFVVGPYTVRIVENKLKLLEVEDGY